MDPVSIIGVVGSIVSVIDVVTRNLIYLRRLQQQWTMADMTITLLIGHLATLKAALNQISEWIGTSLSSMPQHHQLVMDLTMSLESCKLLVLFMNSHIDRLELSDDDTLKLRSRVRVVLEDQSVKDCVNHLNTQANALNLLLTAFNCRSLSEQKCILESKQTRELFNLVKDDSSSLRCLCDADSFFSGNTTSTKTSSVLSVIFGFDHELFTSKVYQRAMRNVIRRSVRTKKKSLENSGDKRKSKELEESINKDRLANHSKINLLLTGLPGSGKTTLMKQLESSYNIAPRQSNQSMVLGFVTQGMREVLKGMDTLKLSFENGWSDSYAQSMLDVSGIEDSAEGRFSIPLEMAVAMQSLFNDGAFQECVRRSEEYHLDSDYKYFLGSSDRDRLVQPYYVPTAEDILRARDSRRGSIPETTVKVDELTYCVLQVDPRLILRKQLGAFLDTATMLIFVVDVSEYDTPYSEGQTSTSLHEALAQFDSVCLSPSYSKMPKTLIFNKLDLFKEKLSSSSLKDSFSDFAGGADYQEALNYILNKFVSCSHNPESTYAHFKPGKNDNTVWNLIIDATKDVIVQEALGSTSEFTSK